MTQCRWSGWPGAWCQDCGREDPAEICLAGECVLKDDLNAEMDKDNIIHIMCHNQSTEDCKVVKKKKVIYTI
jgi:hypothetical protein